MHLFFLPQGPQSTFCVPLWFSFVPFVFILASPLLNQQTLFTNCEIGENDLPEGHKFK